MPAVIEKVRRKIKAKEGAGAAKIPALMKAAAMERFGGPEVLKLHKLPVPEPGPEEVLIEVHAAGVGYWDLKARDGSWAPTDTEFPFVMGCDGAGFVAARGGRVRGLREGDRVWASQYMNPKGGFYAEYVAVKAAYAAPVPGGLEMVQAGASCVTGLTALQGVDDALRVKPGETVLVFGASGAVGSLALQFAKRLDARVLGTASGREGVLFVSKLGADAALDRLGKDFIGRLREHSPDGIDAVLALAGGELLEQCLDLMNEGGRVAYPNGIEPPPRKRRGITIKPYDGLAGPREFEKLARAVAEAGLRVPVAAVFPLAQAARAHARLEKGHVHGRIVLKPR